MQINTNTLADRDQISHNEWLASVPKEKVSDQQSKGANDLAAAYGVEISDAGRYMQSVQKQELPLTPSGDIEMGDTSHIKQQSDGQVICVITDDNLAEVESLARNMESIEYEISHMIQEPGKWWEANADVLAKHLNAYGHKQRNAILSGKDTYLNSIMERLDLYDGQHQNGMINQIRSMVGSVQHGRDIDWKSDTFRSEVRQILGGPMEIKDAKVTDKTTKNAFGQTMAVYSYMKEMNRQSQDFSLMQKLLGTTDEAKKTPSAGNVQKKSTLAEGLEAYHHDRRIVHLFEDALPTKPDKPIEYGERTDGSIVERPNEETHNSAQGYDWAHIMKEYLTEHPELKQYIS